jgi:hypothetical protein
MTRRSSAFKEEQGCIGVPGEEEWAPIAAQLAKWKYLFGKDVEDACPMASTPKSGLG